MNSQPHRFTDTKIVEILALSQNATAIYTGEDIIIQTANDAMIKFWGKSRTVIGMPLIEAVPELIGQPFVDILKNVWRTGISYESKNAAADLIVDGTLQTFYFDFSYRAILDVNGSVDCILHNAIDVTELNQNREILANAKAHKDSLYKEKALNEVLNDTNEKLNLLNKELKETQVVLQLLNDQLEERVAFRTNELSEVNKEVTTFNKELSLLNEELLKSQNELSAANKLLIESEEKLKLAIDTGRMGTWSISLDTMKISASEFVKNLLGLPLDKGPEKEEIMQAIDPEYHLLIEKVLNEAINHQPILTILFTT